MMERIKGADVLFFDGTLFRDDEITFGSSALEMARIVAKMSVILRMVVSFRFGRALHLTTTLPNMPFS
jgi:hypothetical protein